MIPAIQQFPRFEKGSPSTEYQQIINFCVNYLEGMLVGLIHMDIPEELKSQASKIQPLQKIMMSRERTIRHAFQFQIEKYFADFKSISRPRIRVNPLPSGVSDHKAARILDIIQNISNKHHAQHITQLQNTARRLKTLVHRSDVNNDDNPISPFNLGKAFLASIETLNLSAQKNRHLLELLDHTMASQLGNFYDQIDLGLYYLDILTELTDTSLFLKPEPEPEPEPLADKSEDSVKYVEKTADELTLENKIPEILQHKQAHIHDEINADTSTVSSIQNHKLEIRDKQLEIDQYLAKFKLDTENGTLDFIHLFSDLTENLNPLMSSHQRNDIDKFSHYFTSLLNNSLLKTPLKTQLSRLSCPLLEMVLVDPFFFRSRNHPVNDFIQSIIDFELRFKHEGKSLQILSQIFDELLRIEKPALSDYQPLIEKYETFKKIDVKRLEQLKSAKVEKEKKLKKEILTIINDITEELVVDQQTMQFFYDDWQLLLLHLAQMPGKESAEFKNSVNVAKMLSWFLDHNKSGFHPRFESTSFKSLLTSIEIGLNALNFSSEHRHRIRKQLVKEYKLANEKQDFTFIPSQQKVRLSKESPVSAINRKVLDEKFLQQARELKMGDWVEIQAVSNPDFVRAKLKWKAVDCSLFIFIDQRGHKIRECDLSELGYDFSTGHIRLLKKPNFRQNIYF